MGQTDVEIDITRREMIRQFQPEDAQACSDLIRACLGQQADLPPATLERLIREESPQLMCERAALYYIAVCEKEAEIAGLAGLDMNEIRLLYVAPAFQGLGIGRALLEHLEAMVPPALFSDIFVYSTMSAGSFYRRHGYLARGKHVFDLGGMQLPTIFMVKALHRGLAPV